MNGEQQIQPDKIIFNYACALLARRRYSITEFRSKIEKKFPDRVDATTEVMELFINRKYLDDNQYATLYIREQLRRKPQGLRLIKQKLRQKGISETTLSGVFQEQVIDEDELIREAVDKKSRTIKITDPLKKKQKLFRFLVSRGFAHDLILKALNDHRQN